MAGVSYDLAVWEGDRPSDDGAAALEFQRLYDRYVASDDPVEPTPRVTACVIALLDRYPDIDAAAGEDSPWSTGPLMGEARGPLVYFPMVWSRSEEVSAWAADLAEQHQLNCYDPQREQLRTPAAKPWRFQLTSQRGRTFHDPGAERRDGAPDRHFRTELTNIEDVVRGFVCFLEDDPTLTVRVLVAPVHRLSRTLTARNLHAPAADRSRHSVVGSS